MKKKIEYKILYITWGDYIYLTENGDCTKVFTNKIKLYWRLIEAINSYNDGLEDNRLNDFAFVEDFSQCRPICYSDFEIVRTN